MVQQQTKKINLIKLNIMDTGNLGILAGIVISLGFFIMIFGVIYLNKREKMAMIERGMNPQSYKPQPAPYQNLKWGLLLIGAGLGLFLAYLLDRTVFMSTENENEAIYFGLIAIFGGLGLVLSYRIEKKELYDSDNRKDQ
jgi:energy-coupling factor transporter transmembrane protein EcfT